MFRRRLSTIAALVAIYVTLFAASMVWFYCHWEDERRQIETVVFEGHD